MLCISRTKRNFQNVVNLFYLSTLIKRQLTRLKLEWQAKSVGLATLEKQNSRTLGLWGITYGGNLTQNFHWLDNSTVEVLLFFQTNYSTCQYSIRNSQMISFVHWFFQITQLIQVRYTFRRYLIFTVLANKSPWRKLLILSAGTTTTMWSKKHRLTYLEFCQKTRMCSLTMSTFSSLNLVSKC